MMKMSRPQPSFTKEELVSIKKALKTELTPKKYTRLMVIKLKAEQQLKSETIATMLNIHKESVNRIVSKYKHGGLEAICGSTYKNNRKYLTTEQEEIFLSGFRKKSDEGQILEVADIIKAFEGKIGHSVSKNTVYLMLKRNNWRKVMPRSKLN